MEKAIGDYVVALRSSLGLSTTALAKKAGIAQSTLREIEKGNTSPTLDTILKVSKALELTPISFFKGLLGDEEIPPIIYDTFISAKELKTEQIEALNLLIKSITDSGASDDALPMVEEPLNKYESIAASGSPDPMKDFPQESISQIEKLQRDRFKKHPQK